MSRTIVITGATSGFGTELVKKFLSEGDIVIATGRKLTSRLDIFLNERAKYKNNLIEKDLDVTSEAECMAFKTYLEQSNQKIHVLINNAGYGLFGALENLTTEQIRHQFEVNFFGLVRITQLLIPILINSHGKIFNFSSAFGFTGFPLTSAYCGSKFAVEGFSESLDYELQPHGVQVCLIEPGGYRTKFGTSTIWGSGNSERYKIQTKNYQALTQKLMTRKKYQDPKDLAVGVWRLSHLNKLPMRVPFGKDAIFTSIMRKLLPANLLHVLSHNIFNKIFLKE